MPKTWFVGSVRSGDPSCPPLGLHCAAARLRWAVVDKLKTPWDVVSGFDRRPSAGARPCTDVEDFAWAAPPGGGGRQVQDVGFVTFAPTCPPRAALQNVANCGLVSA